MDSQRRERSYALARAVNAKHSYTNASVTNDGKTIQFAVPVSVADLNRFAGNHSLELFTDSVSVSSTDRISDKIRWWVSVLLCVVAFYIFIEVFGPALSKGWQAAASALVALRTWVAAATSSY